MPPPNEVAYLPPHLRLVPYQQMAPGRVADEAGVGDLFRDRLRGGVGAEKIVLGTY